MPRNVRDFNFSDMVITSQTRSYMRKARMAGRCLIELLISKVVIDQNKGM